MGRPQKEIRGVRISVYLDEKTHRVLLALADELGLDTVSATIRYCIRKTYVSELRKL